VKTRGKKSGVIRQREGCKLNCGGKKKKIVAPCFEGRKKGKLRIVFSKKRSEPFLRAKKKEKTKKERKKRNGEKKKSTELLVKKQTRSEFVREG